MFLNYCRCVFHGSWFLGDSSAPLILFKNQLKEILRYQEKYSYWRVPDIFWMLEIILFRFGTFTNGWCVDQSLFSKLLLAHSCLQNVEGQGTVMGIELSLAGRSSFRSLFGLQVLCLATDQSTVFQRNSYAMGIKSLISYMRRVAKLVLHGSRCPLG